MDEIPRQADFIQNIVERKRNMYILRIHFKPEGYIDINDFKEVTCKESSSSWKITNDFSSMNIIDNATYNFKGDSQVSVKGSDIFYIESIMREN